MTDITLPSFNREKRLALFLCLLVLLLMGYGMFSSTKMLIEDIVLPEIELKSKTVSQIAMQPLKRALSYGLTLEQIRELDQHLADTVKPAPEILYLALTSENGAILAEHNLSDPFIRAQIMNIQLFDERHIVRIGGYQNMKYPIVYNDTPQGFLHVGVNEGAAQLSFFALSGDIAMIFLVALILGYELLYFFVNYYYTAPLQQVVTLFHLLRSRDYTATYRLWQGHELGKISQQLHGLIRDINKRYSDIRDKLPFFDAIEEDAAKSQALKDRFADLTQRVKFTRYHALRKLRENQITYIRPAIFLAVFAETMSISFMPFYAISFLPLMDENSRILFQALPIFTFFLFYALVQPLAGYLAEFYHKSSVAKVGVILLFFSIFVAALSPNYTCLIASRGLAGSAYGLVILSLQSFLIELLPPSEKGPTVARNFMGGLFAAILCGAVVGGIHVDGISYRGVFGLATFLSALAFAFAMGFLRHDASTPLFYHPTRQDIKRALSQPAFWQLVILISIPSKMLLGGVLYFLAPVGMSQAEFDVVNIAYAVVLYCLPVMILNSAKFSWLENWRSEQDRMVLGAIIASASFVPLLLFAYWGYPLMLFTLGIGHGLNFTPQVTLASRLLHHHLPIKASAVMNSVFRLFDITGLALGPAVFAGLMQSLTPQAAMTEVCLLSFFFALIYIGSVRFSSFGFREPVAMKLG